MHKRCLKAWHKTSSKQTIPPPQANYLALKTATTKFRAHWQSQHKTNDQITGLHTPLVLTQTVRDVTRWRQMRHEVIDGFPCQQRPNSLSCETALASRTYRVSDRYQRNLYHFFAAAPQKLKESKNSGPYGR